MRSRSQVLRTSTYPTSGGNRAVEYFHTSVVAALGRFRASYRSTPSRAASQAYTDVLSKGRPVGTVTIARLLMDGRAHGACRRQAEGILQTLHTCLRMIWPSKPLSVEVALLAETEAEGKADLAELRALSGRVEDLDNAIVAQQAELVAEQQLLDALMAARMRAEAGV